ncbi:TPA: hypothetical protein ACGOX2_000838 [Streptococcus suis]
MANKEIIKIEPTVYPKIKSVTNKNGKVKVAAYARVSTEKDNQTHSFNCPEGTLHQDHPN